MKEMKWLFLEQLPGAGHFPICYFFKSLQQNSELPLGYGHFAGKVMEHHTGKVRAVESEWAWLSLSQEASAVLPGMGVRREGQSPICHSCPSSASLSIRQTGPSITDNIDLDRQASQEPIITGSFNQLMPIQLLLNLVLTWRRRVGMDQRIAGTHSPG